jgi:hypothetical protein
MFAQMESPQVRHPLVGGGFNNQRILLAEFYSQQRKVIDDVQTPLSWRNAQQAVVRVKAIVLLVPGRGAGGLTRGKRFTRGGHAATPKADEHLTGPTSWRAE